MSPNSVSVRTQVEREIAAERGISEVRAARECEQEVTRRVMERAAQMSVSR